MVSGQAPKKWKVTAQNIAALLVAALPVAIIAIKEFGLETMPFFAAVLGVLTALTRILDNSVTVTLLNRYAPWLFSKNEVNKNVDNNEDNTLTK